MAPTKVRGLYQPKRLELVEVAWRDSMLDASFDGPSNDFAHRISCPVTCGYFVKQDETAITVAMSQEADYDQVRYCITIPIENVIGMWPAKSSMPKKLLKGAR